ncbi:hypothetical protein BREV_BREV_01308 [Brevundimonas mediterranea]|uniref:Uncharacterized protein n=1 Tax=Brevundimonas mediterranea TaxID=74329 RepID=A0A7Z8Y2G9_9CAUL|nr:hypothetical protein BREV_BREV_01308 [Brevundimonas mediterranea]
MVANRACRFVVVWRLLTLADFCLQEDQSIHFERSCDLFNNLQCGIAPASFQLTNVAVGQTNIVSERFQGDPFRDAPLTHVSSKYNG